MQNNSVNASLVWSSHHLLNAYAQSWWPRSLSSTNTHCRTNISWLSYFNRVTIRLWDCKTLYLKWVTIAAIEIFNFVYSLKQLLLENRVDHVWYFSIFESVKYYWELKNQLHKCHTFTQNKAIDFQLLLKGAFGYHWNSYFPNHCVFGWLFPTISNGYFRKPAISASKFLDWHNISGQLHNSKNQQPIIFPCLFG